MIRQTASQDNLGLSRTSVIETIFIAPKRRFSRRSRTSAPPNDVSGRRFTVSFNPFLSGSHIVDCDQEKNDTKKRRTMEPETTGGIYHDLQVTQVTSVMQKTKQTFFHKLFTTTPNEARRQKRAIGQWKHLTKELMLCDMMSAESSDTLTDETYTIPAKSSLIRQFILNELVSTEESYLSHLHRVMTAFLTLPCAIQPIFGAFPKLAILSASLIKGFNDNSMSVADVFRKHEDDFEIYILYACNFERNRKRITRTEVQSPSFRDMIQQLSSTSDRLSLADYMIVPIQRIARYCLLLKELKKYTHPSNTEYSKIEVMLKSLTGLALAMNNVQTKSRR
ncbi:Dbl homology domain-containing protein [Umbelopsis sp. PMI_123]|nr:Dbl homology domain-containing protein [Umbelopsis sp. PMI_123]